MLIHTETNLRDFDFWQGARTHANYLSYEQLDEIEGILQEQYPQGISDTALNDWLWFGEDIIAGWLGFADFEEVMEQSLPWDG